MLHESELRVEVKLVTTVYADGEAVLVIEEVVERTPGDGGIPFTRRPE